ncbi:DUF1292 domain-containing protein [Lederbergia lenta]|uniref:Polyribonucleotide nucleotidyltransferase n=1 Tax=Lederbergia lenta TaxID=1467 RepID=A0A2X4W120_LEDLE|nr:DUF1292 domain-containing protein [Lederbergia lenta]MEC2324729.1 DUF1292 domain-containing protein [Lederbergia lenta]SQI58277.1 polyribonucleotide nucleotidyltransferase [Lederbergia lenta]
MEKIEVGEIFTISEDEEQEHEVEVLATTAMDGTEYAAVSFVEDLQQENDEEIDVFFLKVDQEGDLAAIESDEEFEKVTAAFEEMLVDEEIN